jgi:hypothetical protein
MSSKSSKKAFYQAVDAYSGHLYCAGYYPNDDVAIVALQTIAAPAAISHQRMRSYTSFNIQKHHLDSNVPEYENISDITIYHCPAIAAE